MADPAPQLHRVSQREGAFEVLNDSGNVILVCQDELSDANYAVLLSEAYQRGYKAGYRDGKNLRVGAPKN